MRSIWQIPFWNMNFIITAQSWAYKLVYNLLYRAIIQYVIPYVPILLKNCYPVKLNYVDNYLFFFFALAWWDKIIATMHYMTLNFYYYIA